MAAGRFTDTSSRPHRIALVNRYAPPSDAPSGHEGLKLARAILAARPQAELRIIATGRPYGRDHTIRPNITVAKPEWQRPIEGENHFETFCQPTIIRIGGSSARRRPAERLLSSLTDSVRLCWAAFAWADTVITLSDPPFLSIVAGALHATWFRRTCWIEWSLDRYPDLFVATGFLSPGSVGLRALKLSDHWLRPDMLIGTGPAHLARIQAARRHSVPPLILPPGLGPHSAIERPQSPRPSSAEAPPVTLVYAGNIGHVSLPVALLALIRQAAAARFRVWLSVYGVHADAVKLATAGLNHVTWFDRLSAQALCEADVHISLLRREASHLCLPAKTVTALSYGKPVLWIGSPGADAWQATQGAGWIVPVQADGTVSDAALEHVLQEIGDPAVRLEKSRRARAAAVVLRAQYRQSVDHVLTSQLPGLQERPGNATIHAGRNEGSDAD